MPCNIDRRVSIAMPYFFLFLVIVILFIHSYIKTFKMQEAFSVVNPIWFNVLTIIKHNQNND